MHRFQDVGKPFGKVRDILFGKLQEILFFWPDSLDFVKSRGGESGDPECIAGLSDIALVKRFFLGYQIRPKGGCVLLSVLAAFFDEQLVMSGWGGAVENLHMWMHETCSRRQHVVNVQRRVAHGWIECKASADKIKCDGKPVFQEVRGQLVQFSEVPAAQAYDGVICRHGEEVWKERGLAMLEDAFGNKFLWVGRGFLPPVLGAQKAGTDSFIGPLFHIFIIRVREKYLGLTLQAGIEYTLMPGERIGSDLKGLG